MGVVYAAQHPLLGRKVRIAFCGEIICTACGRRTNKSFAQGHCYRCFQSLAACDICVMRPDKCHYAAGTCRQPEWGETHCMQPHLLYLAVSSGLKVGLTRQGQVPTRWIDQGASWALPIMRQERDRLLGKVTAEIAAIESRFGDLIEIVDRAEVLSFNYPVLKFPEKVKSHNLDKTPIVEGVLQGIKGQYLLLDSGVLNMRKFIGYQIDFAVR